MISLRGEHGSVYSTCDSVRDRVTRLVCQLDRLSAVLPRHVQVVLSSLARLQLPEIRQINRQFPAVSDPAVAVQGILVLARGALPVVACECAPSDEGESACFTAVVLH
jgi:hypothetical protein